MSLSQQIRGPLTREERTQICELVDRGLLASAISRRLRRSKNTVYYHMLVNGFVEPRQRAQRVVSRGGRILRPFSNDEDEYIQELRVLGLSFCRISHRTSHRFGARSTHSVRSRLLLLAARSEA